MIDLIKIREKTISELGTMLNGLLEDEFKLKMQAATGQLAKPSEFKKVRKDIARIKTIIKEKQTDE
jgi:large subunit ribosomal protein L29|tara:strand:+ start:328 stop:525 length:198 start_codon:yes stop_codon:yes gene_type:complete